MATILRMAFSDIFSSIKIFSIQNIMVQHQTDKWVWCINTLYVELFSGTSKHISIFMDKNFGPRQGRAISWIKDDLVHWNICITRLQLGKPRSHGPISIYRLRNPIIKIKQLSDCFIFMMGIPVMLTLHLYNDTGPRAFHHNLLFTFIWHLFVNCPFWGQSMKLAITWKTDGISNCLLLNWPVSLAGIQSQQQMVIRTINHLHSRHNSNKVISYDEKGKLSTLKEIMSPVNCCCGW